ncbi:MAG: hypothetical protein WAN34_08220 [Acidimicrobiia bacterium]
MLRTPPVTRAPILLLRRPAVLFAVIGTAAILATVAALTPLFLSSAASAALQRELEGRCPSSFAGTTDLFGVSGDDPFGPPPSMATSIEDNRKVLSAAAAQHPSLLDPEVTIRGTVVSIEHPGSPLTGRFLARDDFRNHIELLEGADGPGAYIDDVLAEHLDLGPGDVLTFAAGGIAGEVEIQAVYKGVYDQLSDPYWCSVEDILAVNSMGDLPPPPILVDPQYFAYDDDLMTAIYAGYGRSVGTWAIPVDLDGLTVTTAGEVATLLEEMNQGVMTPESENRFLPGGGPDVHSDLALVTERVQALTDALRTSILPLAAIVLLAAVALIGGSGSYWVDRRRVELQYLSALGGGPGVISIKAALEFLPALLAGGAAGWAAANLLIGVIGPSSDVESSARVLAVWVTAAAIIIGLAAVALVAGVRARGLLDQKPVKTRGIRWRIPLLVLAIAGALLVRAEIGDTAVRVEENQLVGSVDPLVLLLPLFVFLATVLLVAELVIRLFPALRRIGARGHASYLASRRIISAPTLVIALIAGAALPVATLIYAASLTRSATSTIDAKGKTFIGSDISTPVFGIIDPPGDIADASTVVIKTERADLNGETVDLLAVNEETFAKGAFWDESFADIPLDQILATLQGDAVGGPLPAFVANGNLESGTVKSAAGDIEVVVAGHLDSFPGARASRPLLIVDERRFLEVVGDPEGHLRGSRYLMWTKDRTEQEVEAAMASAGIGYAFTVAATTTLDQLKFTAIVWTFDFLEIYSALGGLIAIGGILLYVDTRQRHRNLSYALARRMGLRRSEHLLAGFMEIAGLSVVGVGSGVIAAQIAARTLYSILDAVPETPPSPRWVGATDLTVACFVAALVVGGLAALLSQRTADNANTSELLRHGE